MFDYFKAHGEIALPLPTQKILKYCAIIAFMGVGAMLLWGISRK
jgi:hypothetical protein